MIDFAYNPIIPADYKSRGRGLPYEASPFGCLFLLCFHYTIDERGDLCFRKGRKCERNPSGVPFAFNSRPQATVCAADRFRTNKKDTLKGDSS